MRSTRLIKSGRVGYKSKNFYSTVHQQSIKYGQHPTQQRSISWKTVVVSVGTGIGIYEGFKQSLRDRNECASSNIVSSDPPENSFDIEFDINLFNDGKSALSNVLVDGATGALLGYVGGVFPVLGCGLLGAYAYDKYTESIESMENAEECSE